jgi:colanic acid biosynthesis protein WcaH
MIPRKPYGKMIEVLPILCVDIIVINQSGEYLLVKRENEPRKGQWWVIGGRIIKGETARRAAHRKLREEAAMDAAALIPVGYYEALAQKNPFGLAYPLHALSIVFFAALPDRQRIRLDRQSSAWKFSRKLPAAFKVKPFFNGCVPHP